MLKALQKRIIFQPTRLSADYVFQFDQSFEEFFLTDLTSGLRIGTATTFWSLIIRGMEKVRDNPPKMAVITAPKWLTTGL